MQIRPLHGVTDERLALLLFGAVQATMIGYGFWSGERLRLRQVAGLAIAFSGLIGLMLPGLSAPPLHGSILMLAAGAAWGVYSLRGIAAAGGIAFLGEPVTLRLLPASPAVLGWIALIIIGARIKPSCNDHMPPHQPTTRFRIRRQPAPGRPFDPSAASLIIPNVLF